VSKDIEAVNAVRSMNADELDGHLRQQRRRLFEVRFQQAAGQVENHRQLREIRREIARTMTLQIELAHGHHLVSDLDLEVGEEPAEPEEVVEPVAKPRRRRALRATPEAVEEIQAEAPAVEAVEAEVPAVEDREAEDAAAEGAEPLAEEGEGSPDDAGPDEGDE
jgi:large subunit ribosomal protein L29